MLIKSSILAPLVALVALVALVTWTWVMWFWMYLTRIPAIYKAKMRLDPNALRNQQMNSLPASVRWKADNYNHLMEQPPVFYAICIVLALLGHGEGMNLKMAWAYVFIRIIHSLVQALTNKIPVRFILFVLSSLVLMGLTFNTLKLFLYE